MATVPQIRKGVAPLRAAQGNSFVWRKLHSLSGIVPLGLFLVEHLLSNFEALKGPIAYGDQVRFLNGLPLVRVLEFAFIFLPILYHMLYGISIWFRGRSNVNAYPFAGNWGYVAQRWTGLIAGLYILQHVIRQRFLGISLPEHPYAAFHKVQTELSNPFYLVIYIVAILAICWHFSYGVWLFAAKWGITPGETARKRFGYVCTVLGLALAILGLSSLYAFAFDARYQNTPENISAGVQP